MARRVPWASPLASLSKLFYCSFENPFAKPTRFPGTRESAWPVKKFMGLYPYISSDVVVFWLITQCCAVRLTWNSAISWRCYGSCCYALCFYPYLSGTQVTLPLAGKKEEAQKRHMIGRNQITRPTPSLTHTLKTNQKESFLIKAAFRNLVSRNLILLHLVFNYYLSSDTPSIWENVTFVSHCWLDKAFMAAPLRCRKISTPN